MAEIELTPQALLRDAATKIDAALVLLNVRHRVCKECRQFKHYENRAHWKAYEAFTDLPRRLHAVADEIERSHTAP